MVVILKLKRLCYLGGIGGSMANKILLNPFADIKGFIKSNKFNIVFTFLLGFLTFGIRIIYLNYGMDTLNYMSNNDDYLKHWIRIGRPGMYFFKKLFGPYMNIWLANISFVIFLCAASVALCFLATLKLQLKQINISKNKLLIIPSLLITSPLFIQQYYFDLQNFEFSLSIFLVVTAIISSLYTNTINKWWIYLFQLICLFVSFSVYQSFPLFVAVVIIYCIYLDLYCDFTNGNKKTIRSLFRSYLPTVINTVVSFALYEMLEKMMLNIFDLRKSSYLTGQILWGGGEPTTLTIKRIALIIKSQLFTDFSYSFNCSLLIGIFLILFVWVIKYLGDDSNIVNSILFLILLICLVVLAFSFVILLGNTPTPRAYVPTYPLINTILFFISILYLNKKLLVNSLLLIVAIFSAKQLLLSTNLLQADQIRYEQDLQFINRIEVQLDNRHVNPETHKLMLIGYRDNNTALNIEDDLVGMSMLRFGDFTGNTNAMTENVVSIMNLNGYNIKGGL